MTFDIAGATARIVAMMESIDGITDADKIYPVSVDEPLPDNILPFCWVEVGRATYGEFSKDLMNVTRDWFLMLYVQNFEQGNKTSADAAWEACLPFLASVPQYFRTRRRLELNHVAFNGVDEAVIVADEGPQSADRRGKYYYGVAFTLRVTYTEYTRA